MRTASTVLLGLAALSGLASFDRPAQADAVTGWNFNLPTPPGSPTNFELYLPGDQTGIAATQYNGFAGGTSSIAYDPGSNLTVLSFAGTSGLGPLVHFGFSGVVPGQLTGGERLAPVAMSWSYPAGPPVVAPVVGINFASLGLNTDPIRYLILQINVEFPDFDIGSDDGDEVTSWYELPYQGSYSYSFTPSGGEVQVGGAQFFTTDTPIPLDSLNSTIDPTSYGTSWTPDPVYSADTLVPEPGALSMLATAGLLLAGVRRSRQISWRTGAPHA